MIAKYWLLTGVLALLGAGATSAFAQNPCGVYAPKVMDEIRHPHTDLTLLAAHRGVHALYDSNKYPNTPENSLEAIRNAANECIEIIELDIRLTRDGVPILSHDSTWGRETNVGNTYANEMYDPWKNTGPNPAINSWSLYSVKQDKGGILLRNSKNFGWSEWKEHPPTLKEAIDFIASSKIQIVLALDVKDSSALDAAWNVIARNGVYQTTFFKIDANGWASPQTVNNYFRNRAYVCACIYATDDQYVHIMPVYNTSNIGRDNSFGSEGGEAKVRRSVEAYIKGNWQWFMGVEINIKQSGGILDQLHDEVARSWIGSSGYPGALAIFNPRREWVGADGSSLYFNSDGRCCSKLDAYWFNGSKDGLPSDTADHRPDWKFIFDDEYFSLITSDNVTQLREELIAKKRRNVGRIRI